MEELDIYELKIEDINFDGMSAISIVDFPAMEKDFLLLKKQEKKQKYNFEKSKFDKNLITGPALIPDKKIYRYDFWTDTEYYVFFGKDTVKQISEDFIKKNKDNVTIEHSFNANNITLVESWIIEDTKNDKANALGYNDLPKGTWMVSYRVDNDEVLKYIKDGYLKGFSIEAFVTQILSKKKNDVKIVNEIEKVLNDNKLDDTEKYIKIEELINEN